MSISYKGFEISPAVKQLIDSGEWTTRVLITKHHNNETREKFCSASNTYKTKTEAERHSVEFGKQIIDGHYKNARLWLIYKRPSTVSMDSPRFARRRMNVVHRVKIACIYPASA